MAKSQQTFNKLEKEKKRKKKREDKLKKMLARKEAKDSGELVTNEFIMLIIMGISQILSLIHQRKRKLLQAILF